MLGERLIVILLMMGRVLEEEEEEGEEGVLVVIGEGVDDGEDEEIFEKILGFFFLNFVCWR